MSSHSYDAIVAVTASDTVNDPGVGAAGYFDAISVNVSGLVKVTDAAGHTATIYVTQGIPFQAKIMRVWASVTAATGINGLVRVS